MARGSALVCGDPRDGLTLLGELVALTVEKTRGAKVRRATMRFRAGSAPLLTYDPSGRLVVAGGTYARVPRSALAVSRERSPGTVAQRAPSYRGTHFGHGGTTPTLEAVCGDPRDALRPIGTLAGVVYRTTKAGDPPESPYRHEFESTRPFLAYDRYGLYVIAGGSYRVTWRGIVG